MVDELLAAINEGNVEKVKELAPQLKGELTKQVAAHGGKTPLGLAAYKGNIDILTVVTKDMTPADLNAKDGGHFSALMNAVSNTNELVNKSQVIALLEAKGARVSNDDIEVMKKAYPEGPQVAALIAEKTKLDAEDAKKAQRAQFEKLHQQSDAKPKPDAAKGEDKDKDKEGGKAGGDGMIAGIIGLIVTALSSLVSGGVGLGTLLLGLIVAGATYIGITKYKEANPETPEAPGSGQKPEGKSEPQKELTREQAAALAEQAKKEKAGGTASSLPSKQQGGPGVSPK